MTKGEEFEYICMAIENGKAARHAIQDFMSTQTFYAMLSGDEEKSKRYARACEARADAIFDEIIDIADSSNADLIMNDKGGLTVDGEAVQRSRLKIDARKWVLSKLQPKKYGDKIDVTTDGEKITVPILSFDPFEHATDNSTSEDSGS